MILRYVGMIMLLMSAASPKHEWKNIGKVKALVIDFNIENPKDFGSYPKGLTIKVKVCGNRLVVKADDQISSLIVVDSKDRMNDSIATINYKDKSFSQMTKREMNGALEIAKIFLQESLKDKDIGDLKIDFETKDLKEQEKMAGYTFKKYSFGEKGKKGVEIFASKELEKLVKEYFNCELTSLFEDINWSILPQMEEVASFLTDLLSEMTKHGFIGKVVNDGRTLVCITKCEVVEVDAFEFDIPLKFTKKLPKDLMSGLHK